jgi:periplasmic protein TonB
MPIRFLARRKSQDTPADETLIRVCLVSRDAALVEEVHKHLLVGFATRGGYEFESNHPDFQQYCDVLFVDLRAAGLQTGCGPAAPANSAPAAAEDPKPAAPADFTPETAEEGLAFIDAIRKSVSHPPMVALCDADSGDFGREIMRRGAYEKLTAPLKMPQLRLALQRAYEFRLAEAKLESFLSEQAAAHERPRRAPRRKTRALVRPAVPAARSIRRSLSRVAPTQLAVGFALGCVLFFAGLVAVRTLLSGMGDALASAGFAADSGAVLPVGTVAPGAAPRGPAPSPMHPLTAAADFAPGSLAADSLRSFNAETQFAAPAPRSSLPGYEPAAIVERVAPRYSVDARERHLQGTVRIRAVIGKDGVPRGLARASGDPVLAQIAIDAIALWRYAPATIDGEPVESEVIVPIDFHLPD